VCLSEMIEWKKEMDSLDELETERRDKKRKKVHTQYQKERCLWKIGAEEPCREGKERKVNMIDGVRSCILHPMEMNFDLSNSLLTQRGQYVEASRN